MEQNQLNPQMNYSVGRLIMMGGLSILLFMSVFLSVLSPYPIGLVSLLFGRTKGIIVALCSSLAFYFILSSNSQNFSLLGLYLGGVLISLGLSEVIHRKLNPIQGILGLGAIFVLLTGGLLFNYKESRQMSFTDLVVENVNTLKPFFDQQIKEVQKSGDKNALEIEAYLKNPKIMAEDILKEGPSVIITMMFLILWANMFLLLKSNRLFNRDTAGDFTEVQLVKFKVPEKVIVGVIAGLILAMWGEQLFPGGATWGISILKILGIFYFFQGFGIYIDFLDHVRISGFLRSMLVVLTVLTAHQMIALVGLFDMFVNFRKFFKKKD